MFLLLIPPVTKVMIDEETSIVMNGRLQQIRFLHSHSLQKKNYYSITSFARREILETEIHFYKCFVFVLNICFTVICSVSL